jgi:hypothetical protein
MSNDMIERVARALAASDRHFSDGGSWDELDPIEHDIYMASARAAIEAMREPTPAARPFFECPSTRSAPVALSPLPSVEGYPVVTQDITGADTHFPSKSYSPAMELLAAFREKNVEIAALIKEVQTLRDENAMLKHNDEVLKRHLSAAAEMRCPHCESWFEPENER